MAPSHGAVNQVRSSNNKGFQAYVCDARWFFLRCGGPFGHGWQQRQRARPPLLQLAC